MKIRHFALLALVFFGLSRQGTAQNFEWLRTYGGAASVDYIYAVSGEPSGGCAFLATVYSMGIPGDSIEFGPYHYSTDSNATYIVRLDSAGQVVRARSVGRFGALAMCRDKQGNFYITGWLSVTGTVGTKTMDPANGNMVFAKFDSNLDFIWASQTGNSITVPSRLYCLDERIYFIGSSTGSTPIGSATYSFGSLYNAYFYGEADASDGHIKWSNYLYDGQTNAYLDIGDMVSLKGKLYLWAYNNTSSPDVTIGSDVVKGATSFIAETDSLGNYQQMIKLHTLTNVQILSLTTDGNYLYIGGNFSDSLDWGGNKIAPQYPTGSYKMELFAASLTTSLTPRWFFRPRVLDSVNGGSYNAVVKAVHNNGFLYFGGVFDTKLGIDVSVVQPRSPGSSVNDILLMKIDSMGNILWATNGSTTYGTLYAMDGIAGNSVFAGGGFSDSIKFGKFSGAAKNQTYDAFITRISDYSITRGDIFKGPYCAGDTLRVPYTKIGNYDTSNYFIAELSNELGNFDGGHRELGRLKSNRNDTIITVLPLFKVASSPLYRIRIRSTSPAVQSYYRTDSFKLLIYSRDKADPGGNEMLCRGDTISISTYGGTLWQWSPAYRMQDSTARTTAVWPDKTTTYKIVIADSSGCGAPDTAFKTIFVRKDPKVSLTKTDTTVCMGTSVRIEAFFSQGDTAGYSWQWLNISPGRHELLKAGKGKLSDTLFFTLPANEKDSQIIAIEFTDACSPQSSKAYYRMHISRNKAVADILTPDTSLCPGATVKAVAAFSNGYIPGYKWQWMTKDLSGGWHVVTNDSGSATDTLLYRFPLSQSQELAVKLEDGCSPFADTALLSIMPNDELRIALNTSDTLLCKGSAYTWRAQGAGGKGYGYTWLWTDSAGNILSEKDSLVLQAKEAMTVRVSLTDGCMPDSAFKVFTLHVNKPLSAGIFVPGVSSVTDSTVCYGQGIRLFAKGEGGDINGHSFTWLLNGDIESRSDSLVIDGSLFSKSGDTDTVILILKDQCTKLNDTATAIIKIRPALDVFAGATDSACYKANAFYWAKASGGKGAYTYKWYDASFSLQGAGDSLTVLNTSAGKISRFVIAGDDCLSSDTASAVSEFLSPLATSLHASDTCPQLYAILTATATGGRGKHYAMTWWEQDRLLVRDTAASSILVNPGVPVVYKAVLTDGCSISSDTAYIRMGVKPAINLTAAPLSGCEPLEVLYTINTNYKAPYTWNLVTGYLQDSLANLDSATARVVYRSGTYTAAARIKTALGCSNYATGPIVEVFPKPVADFDFTPANPTIDNPAVQFSNRSASAVSYIWDIEGFGISSDTAPKVTYKDTGLYSILLVAISDKGCRDSMEKLLLISPNYHVWIPTSFSPNGDGHNDYFYIHNSGTKFTGFVIYDRWGELIYETDENKPWDGTFDGKPVPEGVYVYLLKVQKFTATREYMKGTFTLLR